MERADLIKQINKFLEIQGITPYEVAKRAGVSDTSVYAILSPRKKKCPDINSLEILCKGLNITLSQLFEFASPKQGPTYLNEDEDEWMEMYRSTPKERVPALKAYVRMFNNYCDEEPLKKK